MSIVRTLHNKENPYVQINRKALWDPDLSLEAVGLWSRLLSRPDDWEVSVTELSKSCNTSTKQIYRLLNDLIKCGYAWRQQGRKKDGDFGKYETYVFEFKVSPDEIKEMFTVAHFTLSGDALSVQCPTTNTDLTKSSSSLRSEEEICKKVEAPPPSADAELLTDFFLGKIRERNPAFKEPNRQQWLRDFDLLLRIDSRNADQTKLLIEWAADDNWWSHACLSPSKLRKDYDKMVMQKSSANVKNNSKINIAYAKSLKEKYPEQMKAMTFDSKYVSNIPAGKEVKLDMEPKIFMEILPTLFGGRYVPRG